MARSHLAAAALGAGAALVARRLARPEVARTASLAGSTVARPTAAAWITDLLNAAYYAKEPGERDLDDLRLAFVVLTTYWNEHGARRLGAPDLVRFHRAFGTARLRGSGGRTGTLDRSALLAGGASLCGDWFPEAVLDWERTGWGIAFPSSRAKRAHDPERRLVRSRLGPLTPPERPEVEQTWHTYPPVEVPDAAATVDALLAVEHWPDYMSELGRFTPLRRRGLDGQTFEIEVVGFPSPRTPVLTRGYVTVDDLVTSDDAGSLDAWVSAVRSGFSRRPEEPAAIPDDAEVHAGLDLVTHEGHFLGNARNRLVVYRQGERSYVRAAGSWDPMVWHQAQLYEHVGRWSQQAFWGPETADHSMLCQLARQTQRRMTARGPIPSTTEPPAAGPSSGG
jgi:hypothetical protein